MNLEQQSLLFDRYPAILQSHPDAPGRNGVGITCGEGWFAIIDQMLAGLSPLLAQLAGLSNPPRLYEIGRDNNRLRVLMRPMTAEMSSHVYHAMTSSETVCEHCGGDKQGNAASSLCERCRGLP